MKMLRGAHRYINAARQIFEYLLRGSMESRLVSPRARAVTRDDLASAVYRRVGASRAEAHALVDMMLAEIAGALSRGENVKFGQRLDTLREITGGWDDPVAALEAHVALRLDAISADE